MSRLNQPQSAIIHITKVCQVCVIFAWYHRTKVSSSTTSKVIMLRYPPHGEIFHWGTWWAPVNWKIWSLRLPTFGVKNIPLKVPRTALQLCWGQLEHILCSHIHKHLNKHILISLPHGFRSRHFCESQLITTIHDLMLRYDQKKQIDIAILDFSKAFDIVPHKQLLKKLMNYSIDGQTWSWIAAFLRNRTKCVVVDGEILHPPESNQSPTGKGPWTAAFSALYQWPAEQCNIPGPSVCKRLSAV